MYATISFSAIWFSSLWVYSNQSLSIGISIVLYNSSRPVLTVISYFCFLRRPIKMALQAKYALEGQMFPGWICRVPYKNLDIPSIKASAHFETQSTSLAHTAGSHLAVINSIALWTVRLCRQIVEARKWKPWNWKRQLRNRLKIAV